MPDCYHNRHKEGFEDYKRTAKSNIMGKALEFMGLKKDGNEVDIELSISTCTIGGESCFTSIIRDTTERKKLEQGIIQEKEKVELANKELQKAYDDLKLWQAINLQQEKMASIGNLAAGVAHEINNPMGFISSNLGTLGNYVGKLEEFIQVQESIIKKVETSSVLQEITEKRNKLKLDFILDDIKNLVKESMDGSNRVTKIVQDLKNFSRPSEEKWQIADLNDCIKSTLNIIWNELKYTCTVKEEYGKIEQTKCMPQYLNQVFMNILINAGHAITNKGEIIIKTWQDKESIFVSISDTGSGILKENLNKIFDPFFTTKDVGKGTGLGMSISYDIIKKHNGTITVESEEGKGATFIVRIPLLSS